MEQRGEVLSAGRQGRKKMLTAAHVTELSAICDRMSGELALPSQVYCDVFRRKLMGWWGHVGAEHHLDEGIPSHVRGLLQETWAVNVTHRSCASVTFIDGFLNPDGGDTPWHLLLDLASIHWATETRAQIPEHIKFAFIAAGETSCDNR